MAQKLAVSGMWKEFLATFYTWDSHKVHLIPKETFLSLPNPSMGVKETPGISGGACYVAGIFLPHHLWLTSCGILL